MYDYKHYKLTKEIAMPSFIWDASTSVYQNLQNGNHTPIDQRERIKHLAILCSEPLSGNGNSANPASRVNTLNDDGSITLGNDQEKALPAYRQARLDAIAIATAAGNIYRLGEDKEGNYADCTMFVGDMVINTLDPLFPARTSATQYGYLTDPTNGWVNIGGTTSYNPGGYLTGDLLMTLPPDPGDHIILWIGDYDGKTGVIADAARITPRDSGMGLRNPTLRVSLFTSTNSTDNSGRTYGVYRYVGR